jgi:hypothetical protein
MKPSQMLLVAAALLLAACGPNARGDDGDDTGDDGDDGGDPPDASNCSPVAATDVSCDNGADDDCDGFTDCEDIDCLNHTEAGCPSTDCGEASHTEPAPLVLPDDGTGTMFYENTLTITGFPANLTLTDITKLTRLCVNMEHSWLRDLEISAFAPNGTQVILSMQLGNTGSEVYMGVPNDNDEFGTPIPGTGYEYCWSPMAGRLDMLPYCNANGTHDLPPSVNHPTDDYAASSSFTPWQGTILNGDWRIRVRDLWAIDNGHIFSWSITFDQSLVSDCGGFPTE